MKNTFPVSKSAYASSDTKGANKQKANATFAKTGPKSAALDPIRGSKDGITTKHIWPKGGKC